ncbi:MAG: hypothetical protein SCALA702_31990 [Melioribacteraceae bacterium]|nr:MAG: hypothetical protein SCALA702_31990 [Melioribacteraceae bacterium]
MYYAKPIIVKKNNEFFKQYRAKYEAIDELGVHKDTLRRMLKDGRSWHGFTAQYVNDADKHIKPHSRDFGNQKKSVCKYDLEGNFIKEYESIQAAANEAGVSRNCISRALKEKRTISAGALWRQVKVDKIFINLAPKPKKIIEGPIKGTRVGAFDKDGNLIKEFISLRQASKWAEISRSAISLVVTGRQKTAAGYIWKYLPKEEPKKKTSRRSS